MFAARPRNAAVRLVTLDGPRRICPAHGRECGALIYAPSEAAMGKATKIGGWLYLLALAVGVFGLGAVHVEVLLCVALLLGGSVYLLLRESNGFLPRRSATLLIGVSLLLVGYTAFQAISLPAALVAHLSPVSADAWRNALEPLGESGPRWHTLSMDPIGTRIELVRGIAYLFALIGAHRIASRERGTRWLVSGLIAIGLVLAVAALVHPAVGAQSVFGVYQPETAIADRHLGPLLNPNSLAAWLNISLLLALGGLLESKPLAPRPLLAAAVVFLFAVQLWVASRGGILALFLGVTVVVLLVRRRRGQLSAAAIVPSVVFVAAVVMVVLSASKEVRDELAQADISKLALHREVIPMVRANWLVGVGRGAFESVFPAYRESVRYVVFTHPEHVVLQWATEWGVPVTCCGFGAIAWALRPATVQSRSPLSFGAWAVLAGAFVHNLGDLNSEVPGVMLALSACAGIVTAGSAIHGPSKWYEGWSAEPRLVARPVLALMLLVGAVGATTLGEDLARDRFLLRAGVREGRAWDTFLSQAREAILRHPAEPFLPFMVAARASADRPERALAWCGRTLDRARVYGPAHLLLGRILSAARPSQARLEFRLAMEQAPELMAQTARAGLAVATNYDEVLDLVPSRNADDALAVLASGLSDRLPATQALIDGEVLRRPPSRYESLLRVGRTTLHAIEQGPAAPWCEEARSACLEALRAAGGDSVARAPERWEGHVLLAQADAMAGRPREAIAALRAVTAKVNVPSRSVVAEIQIARAAEFWDEVDASVERLTRLPCIHEDACVGNLTYAADVEQQRGRADRSLALYSKALDRFPNNDHALEGLAATASGLQLHARSLEAYLKLCRRHPDNQRFVEGAARERTAIGAPLRR